MSLTNKQKTWIDKLKGKKSVKKIAGELNISEDEVALYLNEKKTSLPAAIFYIILIFIPVLFFVLLESGLRIFNYGHDLSQWREVPGDKIVLSPDVAYRYFYNTAGVPYSSGDAFDKVKKENTFRIFIIGESSAAGYPFSPNGSFGKYIRKRLQLINPGRYIEVINISMAAINTYTLRDLFPGIIDQKPDIIICYTGHNEYYGALGIGSAESLGGYRGIIKTMLYLNKFKTTQLVRNTIKAVVSLFSSSQEKGGTLMSRMAQDQQIIFHSEKFNAGIDQFRSNISDIADMANDAGVPFVIGTLISNLKDQPPFISDKEKNLPSAGEIYQQAVSEYGKGNIEKADGLFRYAKDLDALRFRAPEEVNKVIRSLTAEKKLFLADVDSAFRYLAVGKIIGNEFMTDHLHPTLEGYQKIGKIFFDGMMKHNLLPSEKNIPAEVQDSIVISDYDFTGLDSTIAKYRIITLKSDWPYVKYPKPVKEILAEINARNYVDTLALLVVDSKLDWERAHRQLALKYLDDKDLRDFVREMDVVIDQYPFVPEYYIITSKALIEGIQFEMAMPYLNQYYVLRPDAFSSKWLGIIQLSIGKVKEAVKYLEASRKFDNTDPQVHYNLAGAYALNKEYQKALEQVNLTLELNKNNQDALDLQKQLIEIIKKIEAPKTN